MCCNYIHFSLITRMNFPLLFIVALSVLFNLICNTPSTAISVHTHSHSKERLEDGGTIHHGSHDHKNRPKKTESELIHEVMLGSAKEAEEFDHLSPEESKRRLSLLLTKIDTNNDNFIDSEELYSWIIKSFKTLSDEEAFDRFEDADSDEDGYVTWEEQLYDSFGEQKEFDENNSDDAMLIKSDKRLFETSDKDKDGKLDKNEYKRFCNPEEFADMLPTMVINTLAEKDKDNDGFINFEEFVGNYDKLRDEEFVLAERQTFDSEFDKNGDGLLNAHEIANWIMPNSSQIAVEETRHLMAATDDDHDYLLSYDEILNNHELFVGSEVTDFGEHLVNLNKIMDEL